MPCYYKIVYSEEENVVKYIAITGMTYGDALAEFFICSWFETTFYDEVCLVNNKPIDAILLLKEFRDGKAKQISSREFMNAYHKIVGESIDTLKKTLVG